MLDEVVPHRPGALLPRQPYDHGNANAFFIEELLAAQVTDTMVGPEKDRGRIQTPSNLEISQYPANLFVGLDPRIQILRPVLAKLRVTRDSMAAKPPCRDPHGFALCGSCHLSTEIVRI